MIYAIIVYPVTLSCPPKADPEKARRRVVHGLSKVATSVAVDAVEKEQEGHMSDHDDQRDDQKREASAVVYRIRQWWRG